MSLMIGGLLFLAAGGLVAAKNSLHVWAIGAALGLGCVLGLLYGISNYFTGEGITYAVIAHLQYGVSRGELNVLRFPLLIFLVAAVFVIYVLWLFGLVWSVRRLARKKPRDWVFWCIFLSALVLMPLHPAVADLRALSAGVSRPAAQLTEDLRWTVNRPTDLRSVVYIYLESYERTFLDESLFPGVSPRLKGLEREGLSVHGIATAPLMNWTVAGMVASQCGMVMSTLKRGQENGYRPGVHCLGDVMRDKGYSLSYVGGADLGFSGKGRFYREHGFHVVLGLSELEAESEGGFQRSEWGAYDDTVFERAKKEFSDLHGNDNPFGLFILTTATHPHDGYPSPGCDTGGFENPMLGAVHCSDQQVATFVRWIRARAGEDVLIVIASDHMQVAGKASDLLKRNSGRDNLFLVIGHDIEPQVILRKATMVDVAPTVASLLGLGISEMGLGRNLLQPEPTLAERYGPARFNSMIPAWRVGLDKELSE